VHWSTVDGTAHAGTDYVASSGNVRFPVGEESATISVPVIGNTIQDGNRTFTVVLSTPVGAPLGQAVGTGTIIDDDVPQVSLAVREGKASENTRTPGVLRISRTGATDKALVVNYTLSGTARKGIDYVALPSSATIPAGKSYVDVIVRPVVDSIIKSTSLTLNLAANAAYLLGGKTSATVNLVDDERVPPAAYLLVAPAITAFSGKAYQFTVRYTDNKAMDANTVGSGCLRVKGPNGYSRDAVLVSKTVSTNGRAVVAVYSILAPGGSWDGSDNGAYTVSVVAGKVRDKAGNPLTAGGLGIIQVNIPAGHG
jgi:hypothetical protein